FGARRLRLALDSSPLWGAGRVEDTLNLLGHALRKALTLVARQQDQSLAAVAVAAGAPVLGGTSLKATLDLDWTDAVARDQALAEVLAALDAVDRYLAIQPVAAVGAAVPAVRASLAAAHQVRAQDVAIVAAPVGTTPPGPGPLAARTALARP